MKNLIFPASKKDCEKNGTTYSSEANRKALFPSRLRELRAEKGVSQVQAAKDLGIGSSTIGQYETGDTLPDAQILRRIAEYYGTTSDFLLGLSDCRSLDTDLQAACKYTGLSEEAVTWLHLGGRPVFHFDESLAEKTLDEIENELRKTVDYVGTISKLFESILFWAGIQNLCFAINSIAFKPENEPAECASKFRRLNDAAKEIGSVVLSPLQADKFYEQKAVDEIRRCFELIVEEEI